MSTVRQYELIYTTPPESTEEALAELHTQVQAVVRLCHRAKVPFVARGHGTGLSGGALPISVVRGCPACTSGRPMAFDALANIVNPATQFQAIG